MSQPVLYETHSHTTLCKHAVGEPEEYAQRAWQRGLKGLTITCHNPMPGGFANHVRMEPEQLPEYIALVDRAREAWAGRVDVRLGIEADYFPGYEAWLEEQLSSAPFNYVLGSVHPQLPEFRDLFWTGDPRDFQRAYFEQLAQAAETKLFDCLSHPDLIKNETADDWQLQYVMEDICRALDRIAAAGMAMELNTSGLFKTIRQMNPGPEMLREMRIRETPVVIGADAHLPKRVGDCFVQALEILEEAGYEEVSFFLERKRQDVPIEEARASLEAAESVSGR